jgi:hypothetical protein
MLEPLGQDAQRQGFGLGGGFIGRRTIGQHARKLRDLSDPAAVFLKLGFDAQIHATNVVYRGSQCNQLREFSPAMDRTRLA